jgi:acyl-CoA dehydrogenase
MTYVAPLKDMMFVLQEVAGLDEIIALPGCEEVDYGLVADLFDVVPQLTASV